MINRLKTHEFHFVLNNKLKTKLYATSRMMNLSLSKAILFILEKTSVISNKMHLNDSSEYNKVEEVKWDSHVHLYIPKKKEVIYNELKSIHKDNDTYSIAKEIRYLLKVFIRGVELYGFDRFMLILGKARIKLEIIIRKKKVWNKRKVRQLSRKRWLNIQYDVNYRIIFIRLLN